ncbi:MAG: hypothetical protein KGZ25_06875 [Planctomycetes bacterium]|nr:hypothetical protein [Planctomycetota bacterium]
MIHIEVGLDPSGTTHFEREAMQEVLKLCEEKAKKALLGFECPIHGRVNGSVKLLIKGQQVAVDEADVCCEKAQQRLEKLLVGIL